MYTIRQILGTTLGLTMSGVKQKELGENSLPSLQSQIIALGKSANDGNDFIVKRNELLRAASTNELNKLQKLAQTGKAGKGEYNKLLLDDIRKALDFKKTQEPPGPPRTAVALAGQASVNPESNPALVAEQTKENNAIVTAYQEDGKAIQIESSTNQLKVMDAVGATVRKNKDYKDTMPIKIEYDASGKLNSESMIGLLSDLDGLSGVERTNRGWLRRTFLGGTDQKQAAGEAQVSELLKGKSPSELNVIYTRITGDTAGLSWSMQRKTIGDNESYQNSIWDFDHKDRAKITRFHEELVAQADVMADSMAILLGDKMARGGLRAVIEGKTTELQTALNNPTKVEEFKKTLVKSEVLKREPQFLEKFASALMRIGVMVPFSIASAGTVGAYMEQGKLDIQKGKVNRDGFNLTAKAGIGESGSLAGSVDLAGARLEANWNDPEMRISNRVASVIDAEDKKLAITELVKKINGESKDTSKKDSSEASKKIEELGVAFEGAQSKILDLPESEAKKDAIAQNTLTYLAKVESAKGVQLKGIFAAATLSGWFAGLSGVMADTSASSDGLKVAAGSVEAATLGAETLTDNQVEEYLNGLDISKNTTGNYVLNGKEIFVPAGKKIEWHFTRILTDRDEQLSATYKLVDVSAQTKSDITTIINNTDKKIKNIEDNSALIASTMIRLRREVPEFTRFENLASAEQYQEAKTVMGDIMKKNPKYFTELSKKLSIKEVSVADIKDIIDAFLAKTSGGTESRKIGADIMAGKNNSDTVRKYFSKIAPKFTAQYDFVNAQAQFDAIAKSGLDKSKVSTIGTYAKNGFTGLVAYNQINAAAGGFKAIDVVDNKNTQIIGIPTEVTGTDADKIRTIAKSKISAESLTAYKIANTDATANKNDGQIRDLMVGGKVSSYLSFEPDAVCFNLGFFVEPGKVEKVNPAKNATSRLATGTTVGVPESGITFAGIGVGQQWDKPGKKEEPTPPGPGPTPTPPGPKPTPEPAGSTPIPNNPNNPVTPPPGQLD